MLSTCYGRARETADRVDREDLGFARRPSGKSGIFVGVQCTGRGCDRPAAATAAGGGCGVCLVLMGDPVPVRVAGPRTFVRHGPSTRVPLPSHAAAAACPLRHPARQPFGTAVPRVARLQARQGFPPRPARHVAPRPVLRHAGTRPADARPRAVAAFRPFVACLRPRATANVTRPCPCDASTACAAPCSEALRAALRRHHTPGASSRLRRPWRP